MCWKHLKGGQKKKIIIINLPLVFRHTKMFKNARGHTHWMCERNYYNNIVWKKKRGKPDITLVQDPYGSVILCVANVFFIIDIHFLEIVYLFANIDWKCKCLFINYFINKKKAEKK